ncbi:MAG: D-alanyl-D-alanine carboxypeptidase family protein, partial [Alphaproteobacteria bacterium]|nr:D-alanyl-D-alanine carboxypeptidase family protein [Alphaproteobacteria bacterium]
LAARNADSRKYPASLTKIMTLYLAFEALEKGKLRMDQRLKASRRAAGQPASKLGLRKGERIRVDDAILALVTKSANDVATVMAEAISGSEVKFARLMTKRARNLGMSRTTFRNASGLPNRRQLSTARDMARLALAIRRDFPQYYAYFSKTSFNYRGRTYRNHNRLVGRVSGVDGLKTGYIRASGFNLVASANRGDDRLVGVVFGGRSARSRDRRMRTLLNNGFKKLRRGPGTGRLGQYVRVGGRNGLFARVPVPRDKPDRRRITAKLREKPTARAAAVGAWSVQVGAFTQVETARLRLKELTGVLPELLTKANIAIDAIEEDKGVFYRARLRGLNERQAHETCRQIIHAKFDCLPLPPTEASIKASVQHG